MSNLKNYSVVWTVDVEAENEVEAANQARDILRNIDEPDYIANSYGVADFGTLTIFGDNLVVVDLDKIEGRVE